MELDMQTTTTTTRTTEKKIGDVFCAIDYACRQITSNAYKQCDIMDE